MAINKLYIGYKHNFIINKDEFKSDNKSYPIDYLRMRIFNYDSMNYSDFNIDKKDIEIDIYYLLHLLNKINNDYKGYCSNESEKFIDKVLDVKNNKEYVLSELLFLPPIDGLYNGGCGYHQSMNSFNELVNDTS
jgi:hypothetical protein